MRCPQYHGRKRRRRSNNAALPDCVRHGVTYTATGERLDTWSLKRHATTGPVTVEPQKLNRPVILKLWHKSAKQMVTRGKRWRGKPPAVNKLASYAWALPQLTRTLCAVPERDRPRSRNDRYRHYGWDVIGER